MIINKKNILIGIVISLMSIFGLTIVSAYSINTGFFYSGTSYDSFLDCGITGSRHRVLCSGVTDGQVASGGNFSKNMFISYIKSELGTGPIGNNLSEHDRFGASFVIHTMIGVDAPHGSGIMPTAAEMAEWEARVRSTGITVSNEFYPYGTNSAFVRHSGGLYDNKFYDESGTADSWVFKNGAAVVYVLKKDCANPIGNLPGLPPPPRWSVSTTSTASVNGGASTAAQQQAVVGNVITWTHTVRNNGLDPTTVAVNYYYQNRNGLGSAPGPYANQNLPSGSVINASRTFTSSYTVTQSDADNNRNLCRATSAVPLSDRSNLPYESPTACVSTFSIPPPPSTSNDCNPIKVVSPQPTTYPAQSHTDPWGRPYYAGPNLVPVRASINGTTIGTYSAATEINLTANYTTGDAYTVNFQETTDHVTGYTDNNNTRGSEIMDTSVVIDHYNNGSEIMDTSGRSFNPKQYSQGSEIKDSEGKSYSPKRYSQGPEILDYSPRSFYPKQYVQIPIYKPIPRSYSPKSYNWLYSDTTTHHLGPDTLPSKNIGPCYNYALTAKIGSSFGGKVEAGGNASINPTVEVTKYDASLPKTKSMNSEWQITRMVVNPGSVLSPVTGGSSYDEPCDYFDQRRISDCSVQASNSSTVFNTAGNPSVNMSSSYDAPDSLAGTKICFAFSVRARAGWNKSDQDTRWSHASFDPVNNCIIIVKKPKVQIWGGDLRSLNGSVSTSASAKNIGGVIRTFGSWDEYGIFAAGSISGMASGAAFAGSGLANSNVCGYSTLSFTNVPVGKTSCTGAAGSIGNYSNSHSIPDVAASFPVDGSTLNVTPNLNNLQGIYTGGGNVTISGGNIQKGQWIVVNASNANITITGNIDYTNGQLHGIADIPQVVIIANNINIADNVTNIDAWLIAKTSINTCSSSVPGTSLTIDMCSQPLTVNGPVMTGKLYLQRTAGSGIGAASGDPAEVFNLRPDAYLWSIVHASTSGKIQTVYTTELPPRF